VGHPRSPPRAYGQPAPVGPPAQQFQQQQQHVVHNTGPRTKANDVSKGKLEASPFY